jgi:hypothetical protein
MVANTDFFMMIPLLCVSLMFWVCRREAFLADLTTQTSRSGD